MLIMILKYNTDATTRSNLGQQSRIGIGGYFLGGGSARRQMRCQIRKKYNLQSIWLTSNQHRRSLGLPSRTPTPPFTVRNTGSDLYVCSSEHFAPSEYTVLLCVINTIIVI